MAITMVRVYNTPQNWHDYLKIWVVIQAFGATHSGWLNNINDVKHIIGLDDIQEYLFWSSEVLPTTLWFPQKDTLLCEYMEVRP